MFSEGTLNQVRSATNIVELIGEFVQLKKAGQGYVGLCPFHNEKSPSFHVHPQRQCFHCFGCQKGGNAFTFVMAIEGIPFPDAVRKLARKNGVNIVEEDSPRRNSAPRVTPQATRMLAALEWATKYFNHLLMKSPEYAAAKKYILDRGISEKTIERYRIGVSPKGWSTLLDIMLTRKFTFDEMVEAGLVIPKDGSPTKGYDRFRERLMFPIRNIEGEVIGFGARLLKDEPNQPKYLNSPESLLFSKRKAFYGVFENQRGIRTRGEAIIVEGYMDVVGLAEAGVNNAIATMGTALTEDHCYQLKGLANRVITVFDPDSSGQEASRRTVSLFLQHGIFAKDLFLPNKKDPDEFVKDEGADKFYELCEKAPRQITKLIREIASQGSLSEQESARWLEEFTPILVASRRLPDRAFLWDDLSLVLRVSIDALKAISESAYQRQKELSGGKNEAPKPEPVRPKIPVKARPLNPVDFEFFQAVLAQPQAFHKIPKELWSEGLKDEAMRRWLDKLSESPEQAHFEKVMQLMVQEESDARLQALATARLFQTPEVKVQTDEKNEMNKVDPANLVLVLAQRLDQRSREAQIKSLSAQIKLTERMGDAKEGLRLLEKLKELRSN